MNFKFRITTLSNCLEKVIDYRGKTPKKLGGDWSSKGFRAISANNVKFRGLDKLDTIRYVGESLYKKWMKEEVQRGDIFLTSEAPAGQIMLWESDEKVVLSQRLFCLRTSSHIYNRYLKYYLQSERGQKEISKNTSGSTVFGISAKMFDLIKVSYPKFTEQKAIGDFLYSLDAKIELNNRINAELEALAKALYDYWFVQFDFPDANGKPYKTSGGKMEWSKELKREIPEGWESSDLGSLIELKYGKPLKSNIRTGQGYPVIGSGGIIGYHSEYLVEGPGIVIGRKGTIGEINYIYDNFFPIDTTYYVEPRISIQFTYLRFLLERLNLNNMNSDSAVPGLNRERALSSLIESIPEALIQVFESIASPMFAKMKNNDLQNQQLTELRDWLLPMLMNGQVSVAEAEETLAMAAEPEVAYGKQN